MEKTLSIIIPTYNMEEYLRRCLDSLIIGKKEQFERLEVLVVNDGSKDSSSVIAHEYEHKYPSVFKVIDKENGNYGSCINKGLSLASGKYLKILDADDYFVNNVFEAVLNFLERTDVDLVITPYYMVDEGDAIIKVVKFNLPHDVINSNDKRMEKALMSKYFQMHAVFYNKKVFKDLSYRQSEGIFYTDQEWMFAPFTKVQTLVYANIYLYCYLIGRTGQTIDRKVVARNVDHHIKGSLKMLDEYGYFKMEDDVMKHYMMHRLNTRVSDVFKIFLLNDLPQKDLVIYDQQIKKINSSFYDEMNKITLNRYYPYHFIREWRKGNFPSIWFNQYKILKHHSA